MATAWAIDEATLSIDRVEGDGWIASGIELRLDTSAEPMLADISVARIAIPKLKVSLARTRVRCGAFEITDEAYACKDARIATSLPELGPQQLRASVRYERRTGAIRAQLANVRFAEGSANADLLLESQRETVTFGLNKVSVPQIAKLAARFGFALPLEISQGTVSGSLHAQASGQELRRATFNLEVDKLTANNDAGTIATDKLNVAIEGELQSRASLAYRFAVHSSAGQAYFDPIFVDTGVHAMELQARGEWSDSRGLLANAFTFRHADVVTASGSARLDLNAEQPIRELHVANAQVHFPGTYETYLQPFVANDTLKSLRTDGSAAVSVAVESGEPQNVELRIDSFSADGGSLLGVDQLSGVLNWQAHEAEREAIDGQSTLSWRGASIYGLHVGTSALRFSIAAHSFHLLEPAHIPLLDGAIDLEALRIRNLGEPNVAFMVDATVQPISVPQLCRAFGWPEFGGQVGGVISKLRMREGVITLGTTLSGTVFDGSVAVRDLRLEQPFGNWPRFYASIGFENLDLEQVTSAFSFGRITGKLSGVIDHLELFNWAPVAFDAHLFTPPNDKSRHRISQRAVQNIGNLGGGGSGITAALSSGFLRFFEDFNYDRIGLSCRLENDVCIMNGVGPAPHGGYYLVKGRGVPRIDVIGNSGRVDWPRLVQQLKAATEAQNVVVK